MKVACVSDGSGAGKLLMLTAPLSFWGGVDPATGNIVAARHPQEGVAIGGRILVIPKTIGSSSSSSVLLELIRNNHHPAGLILGELDAILIVGCLVAREMGMSPPPVAVVRPPRISLLLEGHYRMSGDTLQRTR